MAQNFVFSNQTSAAAPASGYTARTHREHLVKYKSDIAQWHHNKSTVPDMIELLKVLSQGTCRPSPAQLYAQLLRWGLAKYNKPSRQSALPAITTLSPKPVPYTTAEATNLTNAAISALRSMGCAIIDIHRMIVTGDGTGNGLYVAKQEALTCLSNSLHHGVKGLTLMEVITQLAVLDIFSLLIEPRKNDVVDAIQIHFRALASLFDEWTSSCDWPDATSALPLCVKALMMRFLPFPTSYSPIIVHRGDCQIHGFKDPDGIVGISFSLCEIVEGAWLRTESHQKLIAQVFLSLTGRLNIRLPPSPTLLPNSSEGHVVWV